MFFSEFFLFLFGSDFAEWFHQSDHWAMLFWWLFILGSATVTVGILTYKRKRREQRFRRMMELWDDARIYYGEREPQFCPEHPVSRGEMDTGGAGDDCTPVRVDNAPFRRRTSASRFRRRGRRLH